MPSPAAHTAHRWRKLEEPRDVGLDSATAVAHGRPLALWSADMYDASGALLQAASGSQSGLLISIKSQRLPRACTHVPAEAAFQTQACCCQRDASIPYAFHNEHAACRLTSRRE